VRALSAAGAARLLAAGAASPRAATARPWGAVLARGDERTVRALARALRRSGRASLLAVEPALLAAQPELGALAPGEVRATTAAAARAAAADGVELVLAPAADLRVPGLPSDLRAFGPDPARVAAQVAAAAAGWRDGGVLPVPGRFPGEGAASQDPSAGPATVGLGAPVLLARDVRPFAAVAAAVPAIQLSAALYAAWDPVTPATLLPAAIGLLRGRLGFAGVVVSADLVAAATATGRPVGAAAVDALRAGCDLLLISGGRAEQEEAVRAIRGAVRAGTLPRARVDEALGRLRALRRAAA
jgi:beta-N-acetylhexosaminidase